MSIELTPAATERVRGFIAKDGGVGLRLGVNAGYMRFSEKQRWLPF